MNPNKMVFRERLLTATALSTGLLLLAPLPDTHEHLPVVTAEPLPSSAIRDVDDELLEKTSSSGRETISEVSKLFHPVESLKDYHGTSDKDAAAMAGVKVLEFRQWDPVVRKSQPGRYEYIKILAAIPFKDVLKSTQDFAVLYGVSVRPAECKNIDRLAYGGSCPSPRLLETMESKTNVLQIGYALSDYPVNLPKDVGLHTILLARGMKRTPQSKKIVPAYASARGHIGVNMEATISKEIMHHELSHHVDFASYSRSIGAGIPTLKDIAEVGQYLDTRGAERDPSNPAGIDLDDAYQDPEFVKALSLENAALSQNTFAQDSKKMYQDAQSLRRSVMKRVNLVSEYGGSSPTEEFAEIGSGLFRGYAAERLLNPEQPKLRLQSLLFLTRLALVSPDTVKYLSETIGQRPFDDRTFPDRRGQYSSYFPNYNFYTYGQATESMK